MQKQRLADFEHKKFRLGRPPQGLGVGFVVSAHRRGYKMGCGVRPLQGLGIKAVVYEIVVFKIGESLFLQGDDNTYSTIILIFIFG